MVILGQSWMLIESDSSFCRLGDFNDDKVINNSDIDLLADYFATDGDSGFYTKQYYYHFDQLGSVIALSDESGNVIETYKYDVFGRPQITDSANAPVEISQIATPYLFTARRYDPETKIYYYRARMYNPKIARFMQTDPMGYGDGIGWYTYCSNNPLLYIDPSGLCGSYGDGYWKGAASDLWSGVKKGASNGLDNFNNIVTFGAYDRYGLTETPASVRKQEDGGWNTASMWLQALVRLPLMQQ